MNINLRPATQQDITFLLDLRVMTMEGYMKQDGVCHTTEEHLFRINHNFDDAKIIEINGNSAGIFKASYLADKACWYLFQIQIHPDFQNLKIGSQLLTSLINKAQQEGKSVGLSVLKSNPAFNLYKSLGFTIVDEDEHEYELLREHKNKNAEYV